MYKIFKYPDLVYLTGIFQENDSDRSAKVKDENLKLNKS